MIEIGMPDVLRSSQTSLALVLDVPWLILTWSVVPDSPGMKKIVVLGVFGLAGVFLQLDGHSWVNALSQMFGILAILCSLVKRSVSYLFILEAVGHSWVIGLCSKTQPATWPVWITRLA